MGIQQMFLGGGGGGDKVYVEDLFSTYLHTGTNSAQTITNGIDLDGEGGLVWVKGRTAAYNNILFDTERGNTSSLKSNSVAEAETIATRVTGFLSNGFTVGSNGNVSANDEDFVSWTFRKAPGFFDVVTYNGQSNGGTFDTWITIPHNLGSTPGMVILKCTSNAESWVIWHRSLPTSAGNFDTYGVNTTNSNTYFGRPAGTADANNIYVRAGQFASGYQGYTYVAYFFAHDDQQFGKGGDEAIIKCGTYTGNATAGNYIDAIGFEPQWVMIKNSTSNGTHWVIFDDMRGICDVADGKYLRASDSTSEYGSRFTFRASGFAPYETAAPANSNNDDYIYMAIRRGPMKTPEDATKVFAIDYGNGSTNIPNFDSGFPVDFAIAKVQDSHSESPETITRLTGNRALKTADDDVEVSNGANWVTDSNVGWAKVDYSTTRISWMWQRAPGFFDVVCYDGTNSTHTEVHNLGVVPEMMIIKCRDAAEHWAVYHKDLTSAGHYLWLDDDQDEDTNSSWLNSTDPTASVFTVGAYSNTSNGPSETYVAYLFASCPGVSKVGSYTGTGSVINVDCGFTASARFVLIRRFDSSGDWFVFDTTRGYSGTTDNWIALNSENAQQSTYNGVDDHLSALSAGFSVNATTEVNINTADYIYLAIA